MFTSLSCITTHAHHSTRKMRDMVDVDVHVTHLPATGIKIDLMKSQDDHWP